MARVCEYSTYGPMCIYSYIFTLIIISSYFNVYYLRIIYEMVQYPHFVGVLTVFKNYSLKKQLSFTLKSKTPSKLCIKIPTMKLKYWHGNYEHNNINNYISLKYKQHIIILLNG